MNFDSRVFCGIVQFHLNYQIHAEIVVRNIPLLSLMGMRSVVVNPLSLMILVFYVLYFSPQLSWLTSLRVSIIIDFDFVDALCFIVSILFIYALIFIICYLLFALGLICSFSSFLS